MRKTVIMKKLIIIKSLVILLVMLQFTSYAQDSPKLKTISKNVGDVIDAEEKKVYYLFDEYSDDIFKEAKFFENSDKSRLLIIYFKDGTKKEINLNQTEYFEYQTQINKRQIDYERIDTTKFCVVKLIDETSISGKITDVRETEISMKTKYMGLITIPKKRILEIIELRPDGKQYSKYWIPNPHDTRHFFAPTGRNMPKGEGYFHDIYLLFMSVNYGFTDYFTFGGGMSIIPSLGFNEQVYFLNPKMGFDINEKFSVGSGLFYLNYPETDEFGIPHEVTAHIAGSSPPRDTVVTDSTYEHTLYRRNAGILFGVGTYGSRENNITLGAGYAFFKDEFLKIPVFMLGGMVRTSRRTALVTENWFITLPQKYLWDELEPGNYTSAVISYGIRFFGEKMCVDLAFFQLTGEMGFGEFIFPGLPYIDFVLKF